MVDSPAPPLLRLPPSVRHRIYLYLGVARWDRFPLVFDLDGPLDPSKQIAFHGLLLSCRSLYIEASALVFSANRFVIHYSHKRSLQPLRNLTPSSLASLASLKIVLNQASCHDRREQESSGKCCEGKGWMGRFGPRCCRDYATHHDGPLGGSHSGAGLVLDEWHRTAEYLAPRMRSRTLELSLVCDLDEREAGLATKVVAPLSLFPELRECHIRLCRSPNAKIAQVAQHAAQQACHRLEPHSPPAPSSSSPRLLQLPRELRHQILEYTDLVTPRREIMWTRLERGYHYPPGGCSGDGFAFCPPSRHHGCQLSGCHHQKCINYDVYSSYHDSVGCFCRLRHAAFSPTCRCWAPPTPLFLVCRTLAEDARFVFFSLNRFVVSDALGSLNPYQAFNFESEEPFELADGASFVEAWRRALGAPPPTPPRPSAYPAQRFAASQFLRDIVPANCLRHLRSLEFVFPPYNGQCWPQDGHPALLDWADTLSWAKTRLAVPILTLRLTMAGSRQWPPQPPDERQELSQEQGDQVLAGYRRILSPLACLREHGLAHFYADFVSPWKWRNWMDNAPPEEQNPEASWQWVLSSQDAMNEEAERFVLGDRYGQLSSRKETREQDRQWQFEFSCEY
ncbi:hypothetical protein N658DRAFT_501250 [Parathielavia hyrcaniae]|uniref:Uncharacterized protein n=1 Tax=Parathielavia hyrcaniae TaxID=113614 RepID=A0AAN6PS46_9PEZI|nr:hypothetical protein N658DRAFT_501250 [Parathielavia hyrcaniae]